MFPVPKTHHPADAKCSAHAWSIPEVAPVIKTTPVDVANLSKDTGDVYLPKGQRDGYERAQVTFKCIKG
jgi:hypothetical protein